MPAAGMVLGDLRGRIIFWDKSTVMIYIMDMMI